jgi:hypothetical protein
MHERHPELDITVEWDECDRCDGCNEHALLADIDYPEGYYAARLCVYCLGDMVTWMKRIGWWEDRPDE